MHFLKGLLPIPAMNYLLKKRYLDVYGTCNLIPKKTYLGGKAPHV